MLRGIRGRSCIGRWCARILERVRWGGAAGRMPCLEGLERRQLLSGAFLDAVNYSTGSADPVSLATGEFTGDYLPDLVLASADAGLMVVLPNWGLPGFPKLRWNYYPNKLPYAVATGDFNSDGKTDVAIATEADSKLNVHLSENYLFGTPASYGIGASPRCVISADLDNDDDLDLAVVNNGSNTLSILMNDGLGVFGGRRDYAVGITPTYVAAGDLNGDGKIDLAVTNARSSTVSVLLNKGGIFAAKRDYSTGASPRGVAIRDFDGDGKPDLAVTSGNDDVVSILRNTGKGAFAARVNYPTGDWPMTVVTADVNADGWSDLAICNAGGNSVSILLNRRNGTFAAKRDYAVGGQPHDLVAADFNGDGVVDLATGNRVGKSVSVLLHAPEPAPKYVTTGTNPYFPLQPGASWEFAGADGRTVQKVLNKTKTINGVAARIVSIQAYDRKGTLRSTGELYVAMNSRTRDLVSLGMSLRFGTRGKWHVETWLDGKAGVKGGMILPGRPAVGMSYPMFSIPGQGSQEFQVQQKGLTVKTPAGTFKNCVRLKCYDTTDPGMVYYTYYAPGVGEVWSANGKLTKYTPAR